MGKLSIDMLHEGLLVSRGKGLELVIDDLSVVVLVFHHEAFMFSSTGHHRERTRPNYFSIFDSTDVEVVPDEPAAPVDLLSKLTRFTTLPTCFGVQGLGTKPEPPIRAAARAGFCDFKGTFMKFAEAEHDIKGACPGHTIVELVKETFSHDDEEALLCPYKETRIR